MGFNVLAFVKRKAGMSPQDFKKYYDDVHIPFIMDIAGDTCFRIHKRYYLTQNETKSPMVLLGDKAAFDYDCVVDLEFEDEAAFQKFFALLSAEEHAPKQTADEDNFVDRSNLTFIVVSETQITSK